MILRVVPSILRSDGRVRLDVERPETGRELVDRYCGAGPAAWHLVADGAPLGLDDPIPAGATEIVAIGLPGEGVSIGAIVLASILSSALSVGVGFLVNALFGDTPQAQSNDGGSPTYGWTGIRNTTTQGTPIAQLYGEHRVGGQIINVYRRCTNSFTKDERLYLTIALGKGPVNAINGYTTDQSDLQSDAGDNIGDGLKINGLPADTYRGVRAWYRLGRHDQLLLPAELRIGTQTQSVDDPVEIDAGSGEWQTAKTLAKATGAYLNFRFDRGLYDQSGGSISSRTVELQIQWQAEGGAWSDVGTGTHTFSDSTVSPFSRTVFATDLVASPAVIRFRFRRVAAAANDNSIADSVRLADLVEITGVDGGRYRGIALVGLQIDATERLRGGVPRVSSIVQGSPVPVLATGKDGDLEHPVVSYEFSRNPAWIALHILLDREQGLGNAVSLADIDALEWMRWASWCEESVAYAEEEGEPVFETESTESTIAGASSIVLTGDEAEFPEGTVIRIRDDALNQVVTVTDLGGGRTQLDLLYPVAGTYPAGWTLAAVALGAYRAGPRHRCDIVFDGEGNGWDALKTVMRTGRAAPVKLGARIKPRFESAGDPVQHISDTSMVEDSLEITYIGRAERPDVVEVQHLSASEEYDQAVAVAGSTPPDLDRAPVRRSIQLYGITDARAARREALFHLRQAQLVRRRATFQMAVEGMAAEVGDIISIGSTLPDWSLLSSRATGKLDAFTLEHPLELEAGKAYVALVVTEVDPQGIEVAITSPPGVYAPGDPIATDGPGRLLRQAATSIGTLDRATRAWRIMSTSADRDLTVSIEAAEYVPEVYELPGWAFEFTVVDGGGGCLQPGNSYQLPWDLDLAACDCEDFPSLCGAGEECVQDVFISYLPQGDAFSCVEFVSHDETGLVVNVLPGCSITELRVTVSYSITLECCPEGCTGTCFCSPGTSCVGQFDQVWPICT